MQWCINMINHIFLEIGYKCNLHCNYCYLNKSLLDDDVLASKYLKLFMLLKRNEIGNNLKITICGGESLLYIDDIKTIYNTLKYKYPNVVIELFTNAILLKDTIQDLYRIRHTLFIGFDDKEKSINNLPYDIIDIIKSEVASNPNTSFSYLIGDLKNIANDVSNIRKIFGKFPKVLFDYHKSKELPNVYKDIISELKKCNYTFSKGTEQVILNYNTCHGIFITNDGKAKSCEARINNPKSDIDSSMAFLNDMCKNKPYSICNKCNVCISRIANYNKNYCYMSKIYNMDDSDL